MAREDSTNSPDLVVGSFVSLASSTGEEFYKGTVYFYKPENGSFGIEDVTHAIGPGRYKQVEGYYHFFLKDIKDLKVIREAPPGSTTTTTVKNGTYNDTEDLYQREYSIQNLIFVPQDDQNTNGASSTSTAQ